MFAYYMPTRIVYGNSSFESIDSYIGGRKTLLVTTEGFERRGLVARLNGYTSNIVAVISNVRSHPDIEDLKALYKQAYRSDFDLILAVGGGSVIDTAKFLSVYDQTHQHNIVESIIKNVKRKEKYQLKPVVAVPTTAGTGSEITPWATVWNTADKKKFSLHLPDLFSEVAIYDPCLTLSVPKDITIQTGLDALSHALESIWNKNASPVTLGYAIKAAKLIMDNLVPLSTNLGDIVYRDNMMKACMYAGLAFSNTQTALAHGMSYYFTANKGLPHGIACSFTLPMLVDEVAGKYEFIDRALVEIFGELSSFKLRALLEELNVSTDFSSYNLSEADIEGLKSSLKNNQRAQNSLVTLPSKQK